MGAGGAKFRDPIMEGVATKHVTSASANDLSFDTYVCATSGTNACDGALSDVRTSLATFYTTAQLTGAYVDGNAGSGHRDTGTVPAFGALTGNTPTLGSSTDFTSFAGQNGRTKWETYGTSCATLVTTLDARIAEIDARIGKPIYAGSPSGVNSPPAVYVSHIPASNTTSGFVPYGRSLYNNCNHLLGQDVDLLGGIIKDIESLTDLVGMVKTARNKYEIYSGRDKEYS